MSIKHITEIEIGELESGRKRSGVVAKKLEEYALIDFARLCRAILVMMQDRLIYRQEPRAGPRGCVECRFQVLDESFCGRERDSRIRLICGRSDSRRQPVQRSVKFGTKRPRSPSSIGLWREGCSIIVGSKGRPACAVS